MLFALSALSMCAAAQVTEFSTSYTGGYDVRGFTAGGDAMPVYMWITGTGMDSWNGDAQRYTKYMAEKGFVGASVYYNSEVYPVLCSNFQYKANTLFNISNPESALSVLCEMQGVDCSKGVVVSGFSQGAQLTSLAGNYAGDIIAGVYESSGGDRLQPPGVPAFVQCLAKDKLDLPSSKIRSCVGASEQIFGGSYANVRTQQIAITGVDCNDQYNCLSGSGSGWYIIQDKQTSSGLASHCYAYEGGCESFNFDHNYATTTDPWGFKANLDWLEQQVIEKQKSL